MTVRLYPQVTSRRSKVVNRARERDASNECECRHSTWSAEKGRHFHFPDEVTLAELPSTIQKL